MKLELAKEGIFDNIKFSVYKNNVDDIYMTSEQLGEVLGYNSPRVAINKIISRNSYLRDSEFSTTTKLVSTDGKVYNKRVLTEDGIYEVIILSKKPKAREFRKHIRALLKDLRNGSVKLNKKEETSVDKIKDDLLWIKKTESERYKGLSNSHTINQQTT